MDRPSLQRNQRARGERAGLRPRGPALQAAGPRHRLSSTLHCLFTAFPRPCTAFSLPFLDLALPFHCLSLTLHCLFIAFRSSTSAATTSPSRWNAAATPQPPSMLLFDEMLQRRGHPCGAKPRGGAGFGGTLARAAHEQEPEAAGPRSGECAQQLYIPLPFAEFPRTRVVLSAFRPLTDTAAVNMAVAM